MFDHRFGRRWRRAAGRNGTLSRHDVRHDHTTHASHADRLRRFRGTDYLLDAGDVRRGLR